MIFSQRNRYITTAVCFTQQDDVKIVRHWWNNAENIIGSSLSAKTKIAASYPHVNLSTVVFHGWPLCWHTVLLAIVPPNVNEVRISAALFWKPRILHSYTYLRYVDAIIYSQVIEYAYLSEFSRSEFYVTNFTCNVI